MSFWSKIIYLAGLESEKGLKANVSHPLNFLGIRHDMQYQ
jgi:hypothetical protein